MQRSKYVEISITDGQYQVTYDIDIRGYDRRMRVVVKERGLGEEVFKKYITDTDYNKEKDLLIDKISKLLKDFLQENENIPEGRKELH